MNRAELQDRIRRHIATAVAAITTDVAEYTAGQVKAAVVPGEAYPLFSDEQHAALRTARAVLGAYDRHVLQLSADYTAETLRMLLAALEPAGGTFATAYGTGAAPDSQTRNTTTPPHNTGR